MNKYCYYTPVELAKALLSLLPKGIDVRNIIDICCGSWNFLSAAETMFPNAKLLGVDVDSCARHFKLTHSQFYQMDGRDYAMRCEQAQITFDLVLSNPPFGPLSSDLKRYKSTNCITSRRRYEMEMLWANLSLMSPNSYLVIILPSTFISGKTYLKARQWLASHMYLYALIELPCDTFGSSSLSTYALILKQCESQLQKQPNPNLYHATRDNGLQWLITFRSEINSKDYFCGNWLTENISFDGLGSLVIYRGNISSNSFSAAGIPVLHCSSTISSKGWTPSFRFCHQDQINNWSKYVCNGDIIINRIGKYAGYWCIYSGEACLISDCIIVIKSPSSEIISKFVSLSRANFGRLPLHLQGLAIKYVTIESIKDMLK